MPFHALPRSCRSRYPKRAVQPHPLRTVFPAEHEKRNHVIIGVLALVLNVAAYCFIWQRRGGL